MKKDLIVIFCVDQAELFILSQRISQFHCTLWLFNFWREGRYLFTVKPQTNKTEAFDQEALVFKLEMERVSRTQTTTLFQAI